MQSQVDVSNGSNVCIKVWYAKVLIYDYSPENLTYEVYYAATPCYIMYDQFDSILFLLLFHTKVISYKYKQKKESCNYIWHHLIEKKVSCTYCKKIL